MQGLPRVRPGKEDIVTESEGRWQKQKMRSESEQLSKSYTAL